MGGVIIGIIRRCGVSRFHVRDGAGKCCCIEVFEERVQGGAPIRASLGDTVWWDQGIAHWTPSVSRREQEGIDCNVQIPMTDRVRQCDCCKIPDQKKEVQ